MAGVGAIGAVTTLDVVTACVYGRLLRDRHNGQVPFADFTLALNNLRTQRLNYEGNFNNHYNYVESVNGLAQAYENQTFNSTNQNNDALVELMETLADDWGFAGGVMNWISIAFVLKLTTIIYSETVCGGLLGNGRDTMVVNWCVNYFANKPPSDCDITVDTWINGQLQHWDDMVGAELIRRAQGIPPPMINLAQPNDDCTCQTPKMAYIYSRRPFASCKNCDMFWCTIEECRFMDHSIQDILTHQKKGHKRPADVIHRCCGCGTLKPIREDFQMKSAPCSGCNRIWCMVENCSKTYAVQGFYTRHLHAAHPNLYKCKACGADKIRPTGISRSLCMCGVFHCLLGTCRKEFNNILDLNIHQGFCDQL